MEAGMPEGGNLTMRQQRKDLRKAMTTLWRFLERYLDCHWHTMLGELLYCTPGAMGERPTRSRAAPGWTPRIVIQTTSL